MDMKRIAWMVIVAAGIAVPLAMTQLTPLDLAPSVVAETLHAQNDAPVAR